jgi:cobalt-precorrin 5A hydrolase/precorrin-3B C17-methyltransferase
VSGRLAVIGTGPGAVEWRSPETSALVEAATDLVGYGPYLDLIGDAAAGKRRHASDNREELSRAREALALAAEGRSVALVSSGDPGIFGMAAAVFEVLDREPAWREIDVTVAPGISAMLAAASRAGAPLGHDFCVVSLSDNLKPWEVVEQRVEAAGRADFVLVIYNPASSQRRWQLERARDLLLRHRSPATPVVLARNLGRDGEAVRVVRLDALTAADADMRTLVIVGSTRTTVIPRAGSAPWVYTPRYYMAEAAPER